MLSAKQQLRDRLLVEGATTGVVRVQQQPLRPASLHTGALQNGLNVYCHLTVWKTSTRRVRVGNHARALVSDEILMPIFRPVSQLAGDR